MVAETLPVPEPIFEFGSLLVPGQKDIADLRPFFPGKEYVGCDIREGPGVDRILDLHNITVPSESVGSVLMFDTLEHVEFPRRALEEVFRILRPNGMVVMSSVMDFPIHNYPHDYWRFTPEAFKSLLGAFSHVFVDFAGEAAFPHTIVGLGFRGTTPVPLDTFTRQFEKWKRRWRDRYGKTWGPIVRLFAPPILLHLYRRIRGPVIRLLERVGIVR